MRRLHLISALTLGLTAAPLGADPGLEVVIERDEGWITVTFSMPAEALVTVFDMAPGALSRPGGGVYFEDFALGTYDFADSLMARVDQTLGTEPIAFEAISLMVHPEDQPQPFGTPFDAAMAMSVCGVPQPEVPPRLEDLHSYMGFVVYTGGTRRPLHFEFPMASAADLPVTVREFDSGASVGTYTAMLSEGRLTLDPGLAHGPWRWWLWMPAALGAALLAAWGFWTRQASARRAPVS